MREFQFTFSQKGFSTKGVSEETALWNQGCIIELSGKPGYLKLNAVLNCLVKKFETLRMRIREEGEGSTYITEFKEIEYPVYYFASQQELLDAAKTYVNTPIPLSGQLFRWAVFETPERSGFLICAHHIIVDGFSTQVLISFINRCLTDNLLTENCSQSYAEYIEEEMQYRYSRRYERDRRYWLSLFEQKRIRSLFSYNPSSVNYDASEMLWDVPTRLFDQAEQFCRENDVSVASLFNAAISTYIFQKYECADFAIGFPVLNRTTIEEMNSIGLYMHILPLVVNMTPEAFCECVHKIEDTKMDLFRHQKFTQYEIKLLMEEQGIPTRQLFDVVFDYQSFPENKICELIFQYSNSLSVPIEIHMHSYGADEHKLIVRYRTKMFSQEEIRELCECILNIAEYALEHPDTSIPDIPRYKLTKEERDELVTQLNDTEHYYPTAEGETIYSLFEASAQARPEHCCIEYKDARVTFGQLRAYAERIDCKLRQITKGKKKVIAILAERSLEMYAAIYGVIRGGNAYLPIAPDYPRDRIDYMIRNSGAAAVLAQKKFISTPGDVPWIDIEDVLLSDGDEIMPPACAALPIDTVYVIYTSGSTGRPKGVKISHWSVLNRILWMQDAYPLEDGVILQKTPYTFDVSVWELFWWGMCGGTLAVSSPNEHFLPAKILETIYTHKVTHLHFVPSVFEVFLSYLETHMEQREYFESVKHLFLSGEALAASLVRRFYKLYPRRGIELHNLYGPTECTVDVTSYDCGPEEVDPIPIGCPIFNTQVYVLGENMQLLPKGIKGELCIGGRNVGQGYLNDPEMTAEKFIPNPFGTGTLYKTGDLAYIREDGKIIFCGRMDGQIKLNGQRVELGEIETVVRDVGGVEAAAVVLHRKGGRDTLVAYYCGARGCEVKIKKHCMHILPAYMVPGAICHIESMPLNQSGKLDRSALTQLEIAEYKGDRGDRPLDEIEQRVCEAFSRILGVGEVGRHSHFFELGGGSIEVIELLSEENLQELSFADFLENPTPAKVAEKIRGSRIREDRFITCLKKGSETKPLVVLFPYAGGRAEVFANLVNVGEDATWYYVDYPHSFEACQSIADEIETIAEGKDLYFYAHCAGSAVAVQIIRILESRRKTVIRRCIIGGSIPPDSPTPDNFWSNVPDEVLRDVLTKAGARLDSGAAEEVNDMIMRFRQDTDFMTEVFFKQEQKVLCPISVIVSKQDIFTQNYARARELWENYGTNVCEILFIESETHYFQTEQADSLMNLLLDIFEKDKKLPCCSN